MKNYPERAKKHFNNKKEYHNCTQAILKAYQKKFNITDELIAKYETEGGSNLPDGTCGAIFAASLLLKNDKKAIATITQKFAEQFGSTKCADLRYKERELCSEYVECAAFLIDEQLELKKHKL